MSFLISEGRGSVGNAMSQVTYCQLLGLQLSYATCQETYCQLGFQVSGEVWCNYCQLWELQVKAEVQQNNAIAQLSYCQLRGLQLSDSTYQKTFHQL